MSEPKLHWATRLKLRLGAIGMEAFILKGERDVALRELAEAREQRDDYKARYETIVAQTKRYNAGLVQRLVQCRTECAFLRAKLDAREKRSE